jgi:outer membrane immunogenic protein
MPRTDILTSRRTGLADSKGSEMKKLLIASIAALAFCGASAIAADMPVKAPPMAMFNWTGFYAGINAGYGWGDSRWHAPGAGNDTGTFNIDGGLVGGTWGSNWQSGNVVFGLEGDLDWSNVKGTTHVACVPGCLSEGTWLSLTRVRLGYAADRTLWYVTGGLASGGVHKDVHTAGDTPSTSTEYGWTLGAGVEWALQSNWSAKLEYLYVDLGDGFCSVATCALPGTHVKFDENIVRFGLNYRFGDLWGKSPVIAKN